MSIPYTFTMKGMIAFLLLLPVMNAVPQSLSVGSKCPPVFLNNIIHHTSSVDSLSSFNDKPLLLSFWSTSCSVSVDYLVQLDALHKEYKDRIRFLLVSSEPAAKVRKLFNTVDRVSAIELPVVVEDTIVKKYFPHRTAPHVCWIDANGMVQAVSGHEEVTKQNLSLFANGMDVQLPLKAEIMDDDEFFSLTPFMNNYNAGNAHLLQCYSYIGSYKPGILSLSMLPFFNKQDSTVSVRSANTSLMNLYKMAYRKMQGFHEACWVNEAGRQLQQIDRDKTLFCYQLIVKDTSVSKAYRFMQQDLDRYFSIRSSLEKRKITVWALKRITSVDKLKAADKTKTDVYEMEGRLIVKAVTIKTMLQNYLNEQSMLAYPVLDETGYKDKIDLEIPINTNELDTLNKALKQYGLMLQPQKRMMEVIVLRKE